MISFFNILRITIIALMAIVLSACATPIRSDVEAFKSVNSGHVSKDDVLLFLECVTDDFNKFYMGNLRAAQQRRSKGYRVELYTGPYLLLSADILDDGYVELFESNAASLIPTQTERDGFARCLDKYEIQTKSELNNKLPNSIY